ncbi:hypothetical protein NV379_02135 [Paenibacillus sp. N1-5-1-14]|uniref:hypothetical protein n=1 Tax=Paenibacillus radicibacter TaxID=2972488 RepID=UPI002159A614|nr:hypothetical protein [Paenibacillus radicibacter]MCR8641445.1 hypothetical protein [Paenibacillus radicibacter]
MSNLQPTYGNFVLKGIVGGTQSDKFYSEGTSNGNAWRRLNFSIKTNDNASVYVEMMGSKNEKVKFVDASDRKNKKEYFVPWADRFKERTDKAEIFMASKVGLIKDEAGKNKVLSLTQFDAVECIKKHLKEGDSIYVRGSMQFSVYEGKGQVKYIIQQIYHTSEALDFSAEGYVPEASFNQDIVYLESEYDSETNKTAINTNIIYKSKGEICVMPYMFFINHEKYRGDEDKEKLLQTLKDSFENLSYGSTIKVNGNINIYVEKVESEVEEDSIPVSFGGFQAKGQESYVRGTTIRELEITGGDGSTLIDARYSEEDFVPKESPFSSDSVIDISDDEENDSLPF